MSEKEQLFPILDYVDEDFPFIGRKHPEIDKLKLEWIEPSEIFVTQRQRSVIDYDCLKTILEDFSLGRIKSVNIARIMGVNICWNGQHTILAMMLNGWDKVPCMVYECEDMSWRTESVTHMRFSIRQRADMAYDFIEEMLDEFGIMPELAEDLISMIDVERQK
jgi:hypothetical protein